MSGAMIVLTIAAVWLVIGLTLSLLLGRRGHDRFTWLVLGTVLGPLALALAVDAWHWQENRETEVLQPPRPSNPAGTVDVLVGVDGSAESDAAVHTAIDVLGPRLRRLTLLTVIPFDGGEEADTLAMTELHADHARLGLDNLGLEVARGHPAHVLRELALSDGYALLAIGTRGKGRAHLFGSTAAELSKMSAIPLLMVSGTPAHERPHAPSWSSPDRQQA